MRKTKLLVITGLSVVALMIVIGLGVFRQAENVKMKSPKEWVMMAVEEEHYILDDDGILLIHTADIQTPSLELVEEVEGKTYGNYLYVKEWNGDSNFYVAFFKHYLVVESYNHIKEYVYISAITWEDRNGVSRLVNKEFIYEWQILDLDIEEVRYE